MEHIEFAPRGVCSRQIYIHTEDCKVGDGKFIGGGECNQKAHGEQVSGNTCGPRSTSCADQLAQALKQAL